MMFELYHSISRYYTQYKQKIIYRDDNRKNAVFTRSSGLSFKRARSDKHLVGMIDSGSVVIYHKLASSNYIILDIIKKKTKAKIIVINHTLFNSPQWRNFKNLDMIVAVSQHMFRKMSKWYPHMNKTCILNAVSIDRYDKVKALKRGETNSFITGRINRICAWKHSDEWVKWCKEVKLPKKMVHEYMGGGIGRSSPSKKYSKSGRNKVRMLGGINDFKEKIAILKSWDVFLYETNRDEGISMSILESLACGVPVICSNHYGNKEVIKQGVNGYVFKDRKMAQSILSDLIENPEKLKKLKETTISHFREKLDARYMAEKYIKIINEVKGSKGSSPKKKKKDKVSVKISSKNNNIKIQEKKNNVSLEKNEKFSILTSSYNKAKYLKEWASSILCQGYRPLEVVLANDLSTDGTVSMIDSIRKDFDQNGIKFKFVNNPERLYCGASYNNAVKHVTGGYVGVLDADDMLVEDSVKYIMKLYRKYPDIAWIYTQFLWCDERMNKRKRGFNKAPLKGKSLLDMGKMGVHGIGTGWRTFNYQIERPDKLFKVGLTCAVDKNMGYRLEEFGPGLFVDRICYKHRGHPIGSKDSVSSTSHAMDMWKRVIQKTENRRNKYNYKPYPIIVHKNG